MKFETGKTYWARSACDHNCIWTFPIPEGGTPMTATREKALEAALRQMLRADEAQMNGETFPFSDAILQARAALALPPDQPAAPAPVTATISPGRRTEP